MFVTVDHPDSLKIGGATTNLRLGLGKGGGDAKNRRIPPPLSLLGSSSQETLPPGTLRLVAGTLWKACPPLAVLGYFRT